MQTQPSAHWAWESQGSKGHLIKCYQGKTIRHIQCVRHENIIASSS